MNFHQLLKQDRPLIMGILNLTPDSFSDGGSHTSRGSAVQFALEMVRNGADIIDVGGESTRPYSERIEAAEQIRRVESVIASLRKTLPSETPISIDTTLSDVAGAALDAGATILNDISAGRDDPGIFSLAAQKNVPIVLMHMQGSPETMQDNPTYTNVVEEVRSFLLERAEAAQQAGIKKSAIVIDPGIGFGKTREHNLELIAGLGEFVRTDYPVLLGTSRKRFLGTLSLQSEPRTLVGATCATTVLGVQAGVRIFRVHDVMENHQAATVAARIPPAV